MGTSANITDALGVTAKSGRAGLYRIPEIEADPYADIANDRAIDEYKGKFSEDLKIFSEKTGAELIPSILRPPSSLSGAFGRMHEIMFGENQFRSKLAKFIDSVSSTTEVGDYLVRWNNLIRSFTEKAFVARALLEASLADDSLVFDRAAAVELRQMEMMMDAARQAFQERIEGDLRNSWSFNFVGMQFERINQPMNMLNHYPRVLDNPTFDAETIKRWRGAAIGELKRLSDPLLHLRGVNNSKGIDHSPTTVLKLHLPEREIDLFVAYPKQDIIDFEAVRSNARSFFYLRTALEEIVLEAGRDRRMEIKIRYSPSMGAFCIEDKNPIVHGALWPFATVRAKPRIWDLCNRMGPGAFLDLKGAESEIGGVKVKHTVSAMVLDLPDELVPDRKITFLEVKNEMVATKKGPSKTSSTDDSGRFPMRSVFDQEEAEAKFQPVGIVRETPAASAETYLGDDALAGLSEEMMDEEAAAILKAEELAAHSTTGALACVRNVLLKG